jgi:Family of unknown function (DUF5906)
MTDFQTAGKPTFSKATAPFIVKGHFPPEDLLPIIPPTAKLASKSAVDSSQAGKVPGRYELKTNEWWGLTGTWPTTGISPSVQVRAALWPTDNVGLRAENFPALDIDVATVEARDFVESVMSFHLGAAPARFRENAPRLLCVFRRSGEEPIRKMRIVFKDDKGIEHAVEFLGLGQQYLVAGTHPSGASYLWRENADLATWGAKGLTNVTAIEARAFMDALATEIVDRGWKIVRDVRLKGSAGSAQAVAEMEPLIDTSLAVAALQAIPNTADVLPMREDLVSVLAAFKATVGKNALKPKVEAAAREWATHEGWCESDYFDTVWGSLTHIRVGPERLFGLAHKHGFVGDAQADFKDTVDPLPAIQTVQEESDEENKKLEALGKRVVYWSEAQRWIDKETKAQLSHAAFNASPTLGVTVAPSGATGVRTAANKLINSTHIQTVAGMTYLPAQPQMVTWDYNGKPALFFNKWTEYPVSVTDGITDTDIQPWLDHVAYLFQDENDCNYLLDFFAHVVQKRGHKIRWAPIIIGNQGVGKDLMLRPIVNGLGKNSNAQTVQPERLMGQFIDFWEKELVIVEEINRGDRTDVYEKMKAVISGTAADTNTIERKFEQPYEVPNVVNFIFFTNHSDALNLSSDDRRFFVIHSYAEPKESEYYERLNKAFYEKGNGWQKVFSWLKKRDISAFNPDARPRFNEAKQRMIEDAAPFYCLWMRDEYLANRSVVTVKDILNAMATDFNFPERVRKEMRSQAQVSKALKFAGWLYREKQLRLDKKGNPTNVYCRSKEVAGSDAELIRERYLAEKDKKLSAVG